LEAADNELRAARRAAEDEQEGAERAQRAQAAALVERDAAIEKLQQAAQRHAAAAQDRIRVRYLSSPYCAPLARGIVDMNILVHLPL